MNSSWPHTNNSFYATQVTLAGGSTYSTSGNTVAFSPIADWIMIDNTYAASPMALKCQINGYDFTVAENTLYHFDMVQVSSVSFANSGSGATSYAVQIIAGLRNT